MAINFSMPPVGFGPGSQPGAEDGAELEYMPMPSGMRAFEPHYPEVEDASTIRGALELLSRVANEAAAAAEEARAAKPRLARVRRIEIGGLDAASRAALAETLGEGEVAAVIETDAGRVEAQESVFAGVWRVREGAAEHLEIGAAPAALLGRASQEVAAPELVDGVVNAPAILTEMLDASARRFEGDPAHVVNLTLLPHTPEDLVHLDLALGRGAATILSRGYGNCRIEQTGRADIWRVRFYNSQDALIVDTFEVCEIPEVALAAPEDLSDSADRVREVVEALA